MRIISSFHRAPLPQNFHRLRASEPPTPLSAAAAKREPDFIEKRPGGKCITPDHRVARRPRYFPSLINMIQITWGGWRFRVLGKWTHKEARVRERIFQMSIARAQAAGATPADIAAHNIFEIDACTKFGQSPDHLRLVIVGDAGEQGDPSQMLMVPMLERLLGQGQGVLLHGGDIYPVLSRKSAQVGFVEPYQNIPNKVNGFGNHDYWGWLCRAFSSDEAMAALGNPPHLFYSIVHPKMRMIWLDSGANGTDMDRRQLEWLVNQLNKAKEARQKVVIGFHHPFIVNGEQLENDFRKKLEPLLMFYGVKLVLTHHEHNFQRYSQTYPTGLTVHYFMQGNGGGFITPTHELKDGIKPQKIYPSAEQSRNKFMYRLFGWRIPVPHAFRWVWAMKSKGGLYKGCTVIEATADGLAIKHIVRDRYRNRGDESGTPYQLEPTLTL